MTSPAASKQWDTIHRRIHGQGHALASDLVALGATYRQIDYWVRRGLLVESRFAAGGVQTAARGSGLVRGFTPAEVAVADRAMRMIRDGIAVSVAFDLARRGPGIHRLPAGTEVVVA